MSLLPESFSHVCLESVACNAPVICFKFGNLSDLSEKFPAIISCEPDVKKIFSKIVYVLENAGKIKNYLVVSKKILKKEYNVEKIAQTYISLYKNIIKDKWLEKAESTGTHINKHGTEYFVSPVIADYGSFVYLYENRKVQKFKLTKLEQKVLSLFREARTLDQIKINYEQLKKIVNKLVKLKLIIKN